MKHLTPEEEFYCDDYTEYDAYEDTTEYLENETKQIYQDLLQLELCNFTLDFHKYFFNTVEDNIDFLKNYINENPDFFIKEDILRQKKIYKKCKELISIRKKLIDITKRLKNQIGK